MAGFTAVFVSLNFSPGGSVVGASWRLRAFELALRMSPELTRILSLYTANSLILIVLESVCVCLFCMFGSLTLTLSANNFNKPRLAFECP